ncbi:MAG TPA: TetR/AcrR family transcriptional regulator [Caulobacteraceae bacterium]|nr:TetR/AcrR family transcriptional regulator [Caulobacteraceae bacterium]
MVAATPEASPETRTRKPKGQGHERRAEILAAAKALILAEGDAGFTTRQLAARVGLSQTGLYVYFKSREEIFDALCRESFAALAAEFRAVETSIPPGRERLRALGRAYIGFGLAHPNEYRLTFMDGPGVAKHPMTGLEAPFDSQGAGNQVFLMIRRNLEAALAAEGKLETQDLTLATHTVWFALHGLVAAFIARPLFLKAEPAALIEAMLASL